jgi:hypothetical protein
MLVALPLKGGLLHQSVPHIAQIGRVTYRRDNVNISRKDKL